MEKSKFTIVEGQDTNALEASGPREPSLPPTDEIIGPPQGEPMPPIDKPADDDDDVDLSRFEAKTTADIAGVKTLLTGLPVLKPGEIKDYFVLHPGEGWWKRPPYCFIDVPVIGVAKSILHLIDEGIAKRNLDAEDFFRFRVVLGSKPYDVFFLCRVPTENLDNPWNETALLACEQAKNGIWTKVISEKKSGNERYKIRKSEDPDAFPEPDWPSQTPDKLITATFKGKMILDDHHPALARKVGRKVQNG
jgi:hypothetical protein